MRYHLPILVKISATELYPLYINVCMLRLCTVSININIQTFYLIKSYQGATGVERVTSRSAVECSATELYPRHFNVCMYVCKDNI